ncbi:MAG TPA: response regulator [Terriglobales bacterium]|nr:response regulator [Terriglobales bacterium]
MDAPAKTAKTILCVDDIPANCTLLARMLQSNGFRVITASSVRGALELLRREPAVHAILMDIHMPEHSGFDAINILKADPRTRDVPVIVVSSSSDPRDEQKAREFGVADYIGHPVRDDRVLAAVRQHAAGK